MGKNSAEERYLKLLKEYVEQLDRSTSHLLFSFHKTENIDLEKASLTNEEFESLEALCGRFTRTSDILIQKIFRLIQTLKLEDTDGSVIDRIEKAEKMGLIDSAETFKDIRNVRNDIAHEYTDAALKDIFKKVIVHTPVLHKAIIHTVSCAKSYIKD